MSRETERPQVVRKGYRRRTEISIRDGLAIPHSLQFDRRAVRIRCLEGDDTRHLLLERKTAPKRDGWKLRNQGMHGFTP
jgi:hypothetical protein